MSRLKFEMPLAVLIVWTSLMGVIELSLVSQPALAQQSSTTATVEANSVAETESLWTRERGDDWPTFLGAAGNGCSNETGILTDWSEGKLKVLWQTQLGEGYGIGSVASGRYLHFDRHRDAARVRCFVAETGEPLWTFSYPSTYNDLYGYDSGPRTSPVIDGDRVYVFGVEGWLHCLSLKDGTKVWEMDTAEKFGVIQNFFGVASTPIVDGDLLLVMIGGSPAESQTVPPGALDRIQPNGTGMVALDKYTGEVKYKIGNDLASYAGLRPAKLAGRAVCYAWLRGGLIGFETATGNIFLEHPYRHPKLESVNASTPVVRETKNGNEVFLSECYGLGSVLLNVTVDPQTQLTPEDKSLPLVTKSQIAWGDKGRRHKSLEAHWNTPILLDGFLFGCSGRHGTGAEVRCLEWATGDVKWAKAGLERSSLTSIDGHFILLDETGALMLIKQNADRFEVVTVYDGDVELRFPCWAAPIVSHGLMWVRDRDQVICFELSRK